MKLALLLGLSSILVELPAFPLSSTSLDQNPNPSPPVKPTPRIFYKSSAIWPSRTISVCWEKVGIFPTEKAWVQQRIYLEYTTRTPLNFVGWGTCNQSSKGIRINIDDSTQAPHTIALGKDLDGKPNGMTLNFTFKAWSQYCQTDRKNCIEDIAVHEFGHAIGLAHEQNRSDTFGTNINNACTDAPSMSPQGENGDKTFGPWDPDSVMNYCNNNWNNGGRLSALDVEGINKLYGGPTRIGDLGWSDLPRAMADVTGSGFKSYCRFVGNRPPTYLYCTLADANGFRTDSNSGYQQLGVIDTGWANWPRYFADVNGDGRADYCRFVFDNPYVTLSCVLATPQGFSKTQYGFNSIANIDKGYDDLPRFLVDVNGDGKADFCRFTQTRSQPYLSCILAKDTGFEPNNGSFHSVAPVDVGYPNLPRIITKVADKNGVQRVGFCRYLGDRPNIFLNCLLVNQSKTAFGPENISYPTDKTASYNQ